MAVVAAPLQVIESCDETWIIDLANQRYQRFRSEPQPRSFRDATWAPCFALHWDESGDEFVLWLTESGSKRLRSWRHVVPCENCGGVGVFDDLARER